ncbi:MAG TPA: hypothetical protein VKQ72_00025 [Aggregatilineales bacterium]|nr:hypothetical protein [Aggregatilineales bacterium]
MPPTPPDEWPHFLREINALPDEQKRTIYATLIPDWLTERFGIDRLSMSFKGQPVLSLRAPSGSQALEMSLRHQKEARDPLMYINMADTFSGELLILLLVVNDPDSPRFEVDVDEREQITQLGTVSRNLGEERRAMEHGLAPGQVRAGLRAFRRSIPIFERFASRMGHGLFLIEPLSYHNAISFERCGFGYVQGQKDMDTIHADFQPGGKLHARLDGSTPFRSADHWRTVRGRSWAIHDGILGQPFTRFQMVKHIGHDAGINTFPGAAW